MVLCIYGFPTNVSALQFEWAWQHPVESLAVRKAAATFKSLSGLANKIKLAFTMLTLPSWQGMNMTVNFFSTKYMKHSAGCPSLPEHMKVQICSMDELPCYAERIDGLSENEDDCFGQEECDNSTSNSDSVTDTFDGSVAHFSTQNKESGEREPCPSFASQDKSQQFGSIMSQMRESSPVRSSIRVEIIEDEGFMSSTDKKSVESRQPDCIQSGAISAANGSQELRSNSSIPDEADIIDLSTPSPSCRSFSVSKKRRVSCAHTDYIDLTNSPSFIQL